jgi:beta-lactam-binding protein with PASTA domain
VRIPDVIGDVQRAATKLLSAAPLNFVVTVVVETSDVIETGRVIRTEPLGDTAVAPGSTITVFVSTGRALVAVPNVIGQEATAASTELTVQGFFVTTNEQVLAEGDLNDGLIIAQSIAAGTNVEPGSAITITIGRAEVPVTP